MSISAITTYTMYCDYEDCDAAIKEIPMRRITPDGWQRVCISYGSPSMAEESHYCPKHNIKCVNLADPPLAF